MESLLILLVPVVATVLTEFIKKISKVEKSERKATILRFAVATFSFVGLILESVLTGSGVPVGEVELYLATAVSFIVTQVPYFFGKKAKKSA